MARKKEGTLRSPTTSDPEYTDAELEFMRAMDEYKRANRRPYPTWREVFRVLKSLSYRKAAPPTPLPVFGDAQYRGKLDAGR